MEVNVTAEGGGDPRFMTSLARGLAVLEAFDGQAQLTVTQASQRTHLSRSSAARCLFTLEALGFVVSDGPVYRLAPTLLPLLRAFAHSDPLARAGQTVVEALRNHLGESSSLAIFDARSAFERIIYICRAETARIISVPLLVGSALPSYCTSNGRTLLASLSSEDLSAFLSRANFPQRTASTLTRAEDLAREVETIRRQGWAIADGELEAGLRSIAVPVRNASGRTIAALNVATQAAHRDIDWLIGKALPELQGAAAHLSRVM